MTNVMLRRADVERCTGLSRSSIYAMMADGKFPRPVKLGARAVGWPNDKISEWIKSRPQSFGYQGDSI